MLCTTDSSEGCFRDFLCPNECLPFPVHTKSRKWDLLFHWPEWGLERSDLSVEATKNWEWASPFWRYCSVPSHHGAQQYHHQKEKQLTIFVCKANFWINWRVGLQMPFLHVVWHLESGIFANFWALSNSLANVHEIAGKCIPNTFVEEEPLQHFCAFRTFLFDEPPKKENGQQRQLTRRYHENNGKHFEDAPFVFPDEESPDHPEQQYDCDGEGGVDHHHSTGHHPRYKQERKCLQRVSKMRKIFKMKRERRKHGSNSVSPVEKGKNCKH